LKVISDVFFFPNCPSKRSEDIFGMGKIKRQLQAQDNKKNVSKKADGSWAK
jgi:hypothetical protein